MPFEVKGHIPEWEILYEAVAAFEPGDVITYDEIAELLGRDFNSSRSPWYKTQEVMLREHDVAFENVRHVGYRATEALNQYMLAQRHTRRARRSLTRGKDHVTHFDRAAVTPEAARMFDEFAQKLAVQEQETQRLARKQARTEKVLAETVRRVERTEEQQEALRRKFEEMENKLNHS